jgi:6-phosphogluconolactonase
LFRAATRLVCAILLVSFIVAASGCGNGPAAAMGSTPKATFAYTTNSQTGNLSGYTVDPTSGELTPLPGFPIPSGVNPTFVIHDPSDRFAIVADIAADVIRVYAIDSSTGMLTEVPPSPYPAGEEPRSLAIDPTGRFVYVASQMLNSVGAFSISSGGVLTQLPGSPFATGGTSGFGCCVIIDPAGKFAYVEDSNNVYSFGINASSGALTLISTVLGPTQGRGLALDPAGTFLYAVGAGTNYVESFAINSITGAISPSTASPLVLQDGAFTISITPSGQFAYTVEKGQTLVAYRLQNGIFTSLGASYAGALGSLQLAMDPTGTFIYVPQTGTANSISEFRIDTSGSLSELSGSPAAAGGWPQSIMITSQ